MVVNVGVCCYTVKRSTEQFQRLLPSQPLGRDGGFLRSIRPLMVARVLTASLGVVVCLPAAASAADAARRSRLRLAAPPHRQEEARVLGTRVQTPAAPRWLGPARTQGSASRSVCVASTRR